MWLSIALVRLYLLKKLIFVVLKQQEQTFEPQKKVQ